jgi:predicted DNA-binding protein
MSTMVRKQIYLETHQEAKLKRMAQRRGISEAELIREAIDRHVSGGQSHFLPSDPVAGEEALQFMRSLHAQGPLSDQKRSWKREDLYQERVGRHERRSD